MNSLLYYLYAYINAKMILQNHIKVMSPVQKALVFVPMQ